MPVFAPTLATPGFEELQAASKVRSCWLASVYTPVAVNGWVLPTGTAGFEGLSTICESAGGPTVRAVEPLTAPEAAVIVVGFTLELTLVVNPVLETVAISGL